MAIAMSQEELAYLLRLQGKQAMRGATFDLAPNDENLEKALLGAAERSLRARGWIAISGDTFSIEQTILGMIGFVLNAPYAIAVRRTPTGAFLDATLAAATPGRPMTWPARAWPRNSGAMPRPIATHPV